MQNKILKISIFNGITRLLQRSTFFFLGVFLNQIGFSGAEIGAVIATYTITSIITIIPSGFTNDTIKSKYLISIGLSMLAIMYLGMAHFKTFFPLLAAFFFGGVGKTLYVTSMDSLFYKSTEKKETPPKIGVFQSINYGLIGAGIMAAGFLFNMNYSFETLFSIVGIAFIIMTIIGILILPSSATTKFDAIHYKKGLLQPKVLFMIMIFFIFGIHFGAEETTYGLFLQYNLGLEKFHMGLYIGLAIFMMSFTALIIGKHLNKFKITNVLLFGTFISGLCHILMTVQLVPLSFFFRVLHETGDAAMFFFFAYGITKLFDIERIGGSASIVTFTGTIGSFVGALIFGPIGEKFGYNMPLIISGITTLIAFMLTLKYISLTNHDEYSPDRNAR